MMAPNSTFRNLFGRYTDCRTGRRGVCGDGVKLSFARAGARARLKNGCRRSADAIHSQWHVFHVSHASFESAEFFLGPSAAESRKIGPMRWATGCIDYLNRDVKQSRNSQISSASSSSYRWAVIRRPRSKKYSRVSNFTSGGTEWSEWST